jgi:hypothetical protein
MAAVKAMKTKLHWPEPFTYGDTARKIFSGMEENSRIAGAGRRSNSRFNEGTSNR